MSMKHLTPYLLTVGLAVALSAGLTYAQNNQNEHATPPAQGAAADRRATMANMQAEQKKLDELVAQMNAATGPEKVDRIAAVVTEMAAMHKRMSTMMMQGGMMQMHMQRGPMPATPPKAAPDDHAEHH
jgi:hypothetical protein